MKDYLNLLKGLFQQMNVLTLLIVLLFFQLNCYLKSEPKMSDKFDPPLRMKIQEMYRNKQDLSLFCFAKLDHPPDDEKRAQLEKCGLSVIATIKNIITVIGNPDALRCAAKFDFVHSISLSQENYLFNNK